MPRASLHCHPQTPCAGVEEISVWAGLRAPALLTLHYRISGTIERLAIPPIGPSARADGLWRHSCCEAFIEVPDQEGYWECNLSPSSRWALYRFSGYRTGMTPLSLARPPELRIRCEAEGLQLEASLDLGQLSLPPEVTSLRLGLSAVIEEADGRLSYWALQHPPGRPDFHHPSAFALRLPGDD